MVIKYSRVLKHLILNFYSIIYHISTFRKTISFVSTISSLFWQQLLQCSSERNIRFLTMDKEKIFIVEFKDVPIDQQQLCLYGYMKTSTKLLSSHIHTITNSTPKFFSDLERGYLWYSQKKNYIVLIQQCCISNIKDHILF